MGQDLKKALSQAVEAGRLPLPEAPKSALQIRKEAEKETEFCEYWWGRWMRSEELGLVFVPEQGPHANIKDAIDGYITGGDYALMGCSRLS